MTASTSSGRDHERPRGERVRRDERHHVALHAPGEHRPAVGEVVARRARREWTRRGRRSAPRRAPRPRPSRPARATRPCWRRWKETSFMASSSPSGRRPRSGRAARARRTRRASAHAHALLELRRARPWPGSRSSPKLTANTGTRRSRRYCRSVVRIVPSPPSTTARSVSPAGSAPGSTSVRRLDAVLRRPPPGGTRTSTPASRGQLDDAPQRVAGVLRPRVREDGEAARRAAHGSALRAAASRSSTRARRARPRRARRRSRGCPAGPGRPDEAKPSTDAPSSLARVLGHGHAAPRAGPRARAPRRPCPTRSRPDLELRLDHGEAVEARRRCREHGRQHLRQRDERDVGHDQVRREGQLGRLERAGVAALDHGHPLVVAKPPVELAVGHVERDHGRRARAGAGSR